MMILVRNLPEDITEEKLALLFKRFGEVTSSTLVLNNETGDVQRFGFVDMPNQEEATAAIKTLHHTMVNGYKIRVKEANPKFGPEYYAAMKDNPPVVRPKDPVPERQEQRPSWEGSERAFRPQRSQGRPNRSTSRYQPREGGRPAYKPREERGERPSRGYRHREQGDSPRPGYQSREGSRPAYSPRPERSGQPFGKFISERRNAQEHSRYQTREGGARPEYKEGGASPYKGHSFGAQNDRPRSQYQPRGERGSRPYQGHSSSARGERPYSTYQPREGSTSGYKPRREGSGRPYQGHGSSDRSARPHSRYQSRDGARQRYKPRGGRPR